VGNFEFQCSVQVGPMRYTEGGLADLKASDQSAIRGGW